MTTSVTPFTEPMCVLSAPPIPLIADAQSTKAPGTVTSEEPGDIAWANPEHAKVSDDSYAVAELSSVGEETEYLKLTNFGFTLDEEATPVGIVVSVERVGPSGASVRSTASLVKAGVITDASEADASLWANTDVIGTYGNSSSLWGAALTAAEINASDFGVAFQAILETGGEGARILRVDSVTITVYYSEANDDNRVCFATRKVEVRSDGAFRQAPEDDVWGPLVPEGFYPEAPPSWLEERAFRGIVIPSQGDLDDIADAGSNKTGLKVIYRPAFHFSREAAE